MEHSGHMQKISQSGFFWPTMYEDTKDFVRRCHRCQKHGNIKSRNEIPLTNNLLVELFDVWGIDFMGPFPMSGNCDCILAAVDYMSKWVEALPCRSADSKHAMRMFHDVIFPRFGIPWIVISDGGAHFIDKIIRKYLATFDTTSQHHTILRLAVKPKHLTNKSKIFYKRP